jgi:hypothetical protein
MGKAALLGSLASLRPSALFGDCPRFLRSLLDAFSVQRNIQALAFLFFGHAQSNEHIDDFQDDIAGHKANESS